MKRNYYLVVIKPDLPTQEYPVSISKKGFFNNRYTYRLRTQRFYASMLSYPQALYYKYVSLFFPFKEEDGTASKRSDIGQIIIRTTI